jgi:hypothetical protein
LNAFVATVVLFSTVLASLGLGVLAANWAVNAILSAFGSRTQQDAAPVLVPSQTHASGD